MDGWFRSAIAAGALLWLASAAAGETTGCVRDGAGLGVAGAMVTATDPAVRRATTVYTAADGCFRLPEPADGVYDLRVRRLGYRDLEMRRTRLPAPSLVLAVDAETDPRARAWALPASRWLPLLLARLPDDARREEFLRQCAFCHQQGSWATRVPRPREDWEKILTLMGRMGGVVSAELRAALPDAFNAAYDPASAYAHLDGAPVAPLDAAAGSAVITEWELGGPASTQHDLAVHPDGTIYSVDTNQDRLYRLDPRTNQRWAYDIPRGDSPLGGAIGLLAAPNSNAHVAPHSLQVAPDGAIWVTLCLGNKVGRFDPASGQWQIVEQDAGFYPHTLRFDQQGRIWYTLAVSNHVGLIDPRSGQRGVIRLPGARRRAGGGAAADAALPVAGALGVARPARRRRGRAPAGAVRDRRRPGRRRLVQPAQRAPHRPHRPGHRHHRHGRDAVPRPAPHALRLARQPCGSPASAPAWWRGTTRARSASNLRSCRSRASRRRTRSTSTAAPTRCGSAAPTRTA
ncbi:MAG: carboxypeptidase regulatory-like domain-containing protein [Candidatus Binatia bacterium]